MARKIGVDAEDLRDLIDAASVAGMFQSPVRCPGGRLIAQGYLCQICGKDTSVVIERDGKRYRQCGAPKSKNLARSMVDEIGSVLPIEG